MISKSSATIDEKSRYNFEKFCLTKPNIKGQMDTKTASIRVCVFNFFSTYFSPDRRMVRVTISINKA